MLRHVPRHATRVAMRTPTRRRSITPAQSAVLRGPFTQPTTGKTFVIDFFLSSHLGDALVTTPLARQLAQERYLDVQIIKHRSTAAVFDNNPFISAYTLKRGVKLSTLLRGDGHMIQRLQRGLGLTITHPPQPEIYLSDDERAWAATWLKEHTPTGRPVCVLSTRALSRAGHYSHVDWNVVSQKLQETYTVVQPMVSSAEVYRGQVCNILHPGQWRYEGQTPGAIIAIDLPLRHYMALIAAADLLVSAHSGGPHIAAAFNIPAVVAIWPELAPKNTFPAKGHGWEPENWSYPTQAHILTTHITQGQFDGQAFNDKIDQAKNLEPGKPIKQKGSAS